MADHPRGYSHDRRPAGVPQAPPPAAEAAPGSVSLGTVGAPAVPVDDPSEIDRQFGVDLHPPLDLTGIPEGAEFLGITQMGGPPDGYRGQPRDRAPLGSDAARFMREHDREMSGADDPADIETADLTEVAHQVAAEPASTPAAPDFPVADPLPPQGLPGDDNLL